MCMETSKANERFFLITQRYHGVSGWRISNLWKCLYVYWSYWKLYYLIVWMFSWADKICSYREDICLYISVKQQDRMCMILHWSFSHLFLHCNKLLFIYCLYIWSISGVGWVIKFWIIYLHLKSCLFSFHNALFIFWYFVYRRCDIGCKREGEKYIV